MKLKRRRVVCFITAEIWGQQSRSSNTNLCCTRHYHKWILIRAAELTCHVTYRLGWPLLIHSTVPRNKGHWVIGKTQQATHDKCEKIIFRRNAYSGSIILKGITVSCRAAFSKRHSRLLPDPDPICTSVGYKRRGVGGRMKSLRGFGEKAQSLSQALCALLSIKWLFSYLLIAPN